MALAKYHCTRCEADFTAGDWHCKTGEVHVVAPETYYVMDAPAIKTDAQAMKSSGLIMANVLPEQRIIKGNDVQVVPGTNVHFVRGTHSTTDPRIQDALNQRKGVHRGPEGIALWEKEYLTASEKSDINDARQKKYIERLENERNSLLEQVKEKAKPAGKVS